MKELKNRVIAALLVIAMVCIIFVLPTSVSAMKEDSNPVDAAESVGIIPPGLPVSSGNLLNSNTGLETHKKLNRSNGKYVNFYVENKGSNFVVTTINDKGKRTFKPGEKGHISAEVTQDWLGRDRDYKFKAVAGVNGGDVNIHYEIAQRDSQSK